MCMCVCMYTDVAIERETDGDLLLSDMGHGVPFRPGTFDGAIRYRLLALLQGPCALKQLKPSVMRSDQQALHHSTCFLTNGFNVCCVQEDSYLCVTPQHGRVNLV